MEFDKDGKRVPKPWDRKPTSGWVEEQRLAKLRRYIEACERNDWNAGEWERGVLDYNKGMLSEKVKVGKKWYRRSDRKK